MDEATWEVPKAWWRSTTPFRGRGPDREVELEGSAGATVAELLTATEQSLRAIFDDGRSDRDLVRAGELYLGVPGGLLRGARQEVTPLGAAVVAGAMGIAIDWQLSARLGAFVDHWVAGHGIGFAAEVGALMGGIEVSSPGYGRATFGAHTGLVVDRLGPGRAVQFRPLARVLSRLREVLASADDAGYKEAVARVAGHRSQGLGVRMVASYLLPTEQGWLDEVVDEVRSWTPGATSGDLGWLISSATTVDQATVLLDRAEVWPVATRAGALHDLAAHVGPGSAPLLARVFDGQIGAEYSRRALNLLGQFPADEAFGLLLERVDRKYVQPVVFDAMERFPRRSLRLLAEAAPASATAATLLRGHTIARGDVVEEVRLELSAPAGKALDAALAATVAVPTAGDDQVPEILRTPPWEHRRPRPKPVVIDGLWGESPATLAWLPGEQAEWAAADYGYGQMWAREVDWPARVRREIDGQGWLALTIIAYAPEDHVRRYLADFVPSHVYNAEMQLRRILGRFGDDATAFVLRVVEISPTTLASVLLPVEGTDIAWRMADWLARSKALRPVARQWLARHPEAAARDLVPIALSKPGKERTAAEAALRFVALQGYGDDVRATAGEHGPEALAAVDEALALDPLEALPRRMPALPKWLDPAQLPPVLLPGREAALPPSAVAHICTMFALSKPGETYAGVDVVRGMVDGPSLAAMAWSLLERWRGAEYPAKDGWVLDALGLVGDDETVRGLAPLVRAWPGESAHKRAVAGLDVLTAIGTDVALLHLHGIAEKVKFRGLKTQAQARMQEVADGLGLSPEQLADRLVPDFGLDRDGSMVLDYGPRRFRVGFDEQLKPTVADEDGSRRKTLPKPAAKDHPSLAPAAYARFGGLKKDVRTVAADQIRRFEHAMVTGRRWTAAEQRTLFVEHPLLWHLARRLVWAVFDPDSKDSAAGVPVASFRVAEDRTLASSADDEVTVPDDAVVGIAHPLHLGGSLGTWSDVFADYEVLQPFPQLGREVFALTGTESASTRLDRFVGRKVPTGKVLGLAGRGWERAAPQDAGIQPAVHRAVTGGRFVVVELDPGIVAGEAMMFDEQTLAGVRCSSTADGWARSDAEVAFDQLDAVTASEVLRDLEALVS